MDVDKVTSSGIKVEKLHENNFHIWKQKINLVLMYREVDHVVKSQEVPESDSEEFQKWNQCDRTARAIIGLSLSDQLLEHVRDAATAKEMYDSIVNVFQRHTLLNRLRARREFYTASMKPGERVLGYINRVCYLSSTLKSMGVDVDDKELAMTVLNGLPSSYDYIITALDALGDDSKFTLDLVKSRLLQEEQRNDMRGDTDRSEAALMNYSASRVPTRSRLSCTHCHRDGHTEDRCWDKYPSLRPRRSRRGDKKSQALTVEDSQEREQQAEDPVVCLMGVVRGKSVPHCLPEEKFPSAWVIDSGASSHMTTCRPAFRTYEEVSPFPVQMGNESELNATGKGDVEIALDEDSGKRCLLQNVLHVPGLRYSLISVGVIVKQGMTVEFSASNVSIKSSGKTVLTGAYTGNLFIVPCKPVETAMVADLKLWHERLGHAFTDGIMQMSRNDSVAGLSISERSDRDLNCEACIVGKMTRTEIPKAAETKNLSVLDEVHSDVCGPMQVESVGKARYFVTFIDKVSRWGKVFPIRAKSEVFSSFKEYHVLAERQTDRKLKALHSDNGKEYSSIEFLQYLKDHGIVSRRSCARTPQQNGLAERMNRTLLDMVRTMLHHSSTPKSFWADALVTAMYIRNRITCSGIPPHKTPHEVWRGQKPNINHIRVFGCKCWYSLHGEGSGKLDARARSAILIGYANNQKAYKLWDIENRRAVISRDVVFEESMVNDDRNDSEPREEEISVDLNGERDDLATQSNGPSNNAQVGDSSESTSHENEEPSASVDEDTQPEEPRRSLRVRRAPRAWWKGNALAAVVPEYDLTFSQATTGEDNDLWISAINSEMDSLHKNGTWTLVPRHRDMNVLTSKWIFRKKDRIAEDGSCTVVHKARLVTRGFQQVHGVDYNETFAPVVKFSTLRMVLALVAVEDLELHQMDVKTAFLNGELQENIFMEQPEGFVNAKYSNYVCKLRKALYGLKQAPRQWFAKINSFLCDELLFQSCPHDPCFYVKRTDCNVFLITLYVDDLLIAGNSAKEVHAIKGELAKRFEMKDCGEAGICLGLEISRDRSTKSLMLSQSLYIEKVLERFGMSESKPVSTPMSSQIDHSLLQGERVDSTLYRQAIGSLMYLMVGTRPDISFVIGRLSLYMENSTMALWSCVKRVLRYINGTRTLGIVFRGARDTDSGSAPIGFCDSDWAGCKIDRKSTSGFVFVHAGGAVSWKSKKQAAVSTSSAEAEYMALGTASQECVWTSQVYSFAKGMSTPKSLLLNVDNQGSIKMAKNDLSSNRTKHIDIRYHLVRDLLSNHKLEIKYCPSEFMVADILTKPLDRVLFEKHRRSLGMGHL